MNKQRVNSIRTWGWFVTLARLLLLGLFPSQVFAGDLTTGSSTTIDDNINTTAFDPLVNCTFTLPANTIHVCTATCCAEANGSAIPEGSRDNNYELGLSLDGSFPFGCRRSFQFSNEFNIADVDVITVTTTCAFSVAGGSHTISCQARKQAASDTTITINDSSITCHCGHSTHQ